MALLLIAIWLLIGMGLHGFGETKAEVYSYCHYFVVEQVVLGIH